MVAIRLQHHNQQQQRHKKNNNKNNRKNMSFYIGREASKLWKRVCMEATIEINLLAENWKYLLAGIVFQYIHGLAARGVHYLHRPGPTLQDLGFIFLPELGQEKAYISETLFTFIFLSFVLCTFHPFIFKSKKVYTVLIWCRVLSFLVASQALHIVTFYVTQFPGPNYHYSEGSKLATLPLLDSVFEVLLINFPRSVMLKRYPKKAFILRSTVDGTGFISSGLLP